MFEDHSASVRIDEHNETIWAKESSLVIRSPTPEELASLLPLFGHQQFKKLQEVIDSEKYLFDHHKPKLYIKGKLYKPEKI